MSTTNSSIKFKEVIDRNIIKINPHIYLDTNNFFTTTQKKHNDMSKKIKSAINTPKNSSVNMKVKSPSKMK